jgi:hypothetical protein
MPNSFIGIYGNLRLIQVENYFEIGNKPLGMTSEPNRPSGKAETNVQSAQQKMARYVDFMAVVNN